MKIAIKRVYDAPSRSDGIRILIDRLWPRGTSKEELAIDGWLKEIAPSSELRKWFGHDPKKFEEFAVKYGEELKENRAIWKPLLDMYILDMYINEKTKEKNKETTLTLLYAAKDSKCNHALCLKRYLKKHYKA